MIDYTYQLALGLGNVISTQPAVGFVI